VEPDTSAKRRWIIVALVLALLSGAVAVALITAGGGGGAAPIDAALVAELPADAAVPVLEPSDAAAEPPPDAEVLLDRPDALTPVRRVDAGVVMKPLDAGVVASRPVDAAPPPRVDAAVAEIPAATLKGLYEQVGRALDQAVTKHGRDATAALSQRYARVPPYLEAVRKPDLRAEAESQLKQLLRDRAALR
jgi:hypothetical protein